MIIDAHAHACGDFLKPENIIKILDENGTDKVILVPGELDSHKNYRLPDLARLFPRLDAVAITNRLTRVIIPLSGAARKIAHEGNQYVYSLAQHCPDRIMQFYWVMLSTPGIEHEVKAKFKEWHFKGIKFHQCWESFRVDSPIFDRISTWAADKGLPIFVHLRTKRDVSSLVRYIKDHPDTTFIIGHLFGLERYMQSDLINGNTYFEISSPQLISIKKLMMAIEYFGAHRVILGSDVPYGNNNQYLNIQRIRTLSISQEDKRLILGLNMKRLLKI